MDYLQRAAGLVRYDTIIIAFVNDLYIPIFKMWYRLFRRYGLTNYLIFATDQKSYDYLDANNINACYLPFNKTEFKRGELWVMRVEVVHTLIKAGINVIHTDIDAFWLKNAMSVLQESNNDLVISRDNGIPVEAGKAWGFTMCCGFYLMRSNARTCRFVDRYLARTRIVMDDQRALNYMILEAGDKWRELGNAGASIHVKQYDLNVSTLSYDFVARGGVRPDAYVFHPWLAAPGDIYKKVLLAIKLLEDFPSARAGLWHSKAWVYLAPGYWTKKFKAVAKRLLCIGRDLTRVA